MCEFMTGFPHFSIVFLNIEPAQCTASRATLTDKSLDHELPVQTRPRRCVRCAPPTADRCVDARCLALACGRSCGPTRYMTRQAGPALPHQGKGPCSGPRCWAGRGRQSRRRASVHSYLCSQIWAMSQSAPSGGGEHRPRSCINGWLRLALDRAA